MEMTRQASAKVAEQEANRHLSQSKVEEVAPAPDLAPQVQVVDGRIVVNQNTLVVQVGVAPPLIIPPSPSFPPPLSLLSHSCSTSSSLTLAWSKLRPDMQHPCHCLCYRRPSAAR